jgi:hypothetical protein
MKRRRQQQQDERRRPLIEMNLISEGGSRLAARRRGCLSFLTPLMLGLAAALMLSLHLA